MIDFLQSVPKNKDTLLTRSWVRGFERRFKERFIKVKTCVLGKDRAGRARVEVRDKVFENFNRMLENLKKQGLITEDHMKNFGNHIANADEVGGKESGKRKKVYRPTKNSKKKRGKTQRAKEENTNWRNVQIGNDHNPFHASEMFLSFGNGKFSNRVMLLHSSPGSKNPRPCDTHKENLHPDWCQRTTTNGSMTRATFEEWCEYLVKGLAQDHGYCVKDNPLILLLDGHTSR